jgi:2-(1,2-epoxy-1,2-dihydrophenyl)acetyl-CoA isomerase
VSAYRNILTDVSDGIGTLTLNRPEKLNAYTTEMGEEVTAVLRAWREEPAVRAVILTGAGRGFCAGVDLDHLKAHQAGANASKGPRLGEEDFLRKLPLELVDYPKPLIAAVNGAAIGVGITMILPCDLRIASTEAKLGLAFVKLGILPGLGSTHLLARIVGRAKALELVLSARTILAPEALEIGLVNAVVAPDRVVAAAREMAAAIAAHRPEVVAAAKAAVNYGAEHTLEEAMRNEERASAALRERLAKR